MTAPNAAPTPTIHPAGPTPKHTANRVLNSHGLTPNRFHVNRSRDTILNWIAEGIEKHMETKND